MTSIRFIHYKPANLQNLARAQSLCPKEIIIPLRDKLEDLVQGTTLPVWLRQLYRERG